MKTYPKDSLGDRMKRYESVAKGTLVHRMPVIVRIDGKAFHTFTRGFDKPFDKVLMTAMQETTKKLCESVQGCVFGYTQSDEITLVLVDYKELNTSAFFDNEIQKICSVCASMATLFFNRAWDNQVTLYRNRKSEFAQSDDDPLYTAYMKASTRGGMFDCRCFNVPKEDVANNILWRQQDATRNSIQMVGQANFSHTQLQNKNCNDIQDMLHEQKGINWNDFPVPCKRGTAFLKNDKGEWYQDNNMPIITQDRAYIENLIYFNDKHEEASEIA